MTLADKLKQSGIKAPKRRTEPLWKGPQSDDDNGGITNSLLSRYLSGKERFRLMVVEGLRTADIFNPRMEYGNMWHVCEETFAATPERDSKEWSDGVYVTWAQALREYSRKLCERYRMQQEQVNHWYKMCLAQFPLYIEHWQHHHEQMEREPLLQEKVFEVDYKLPSGRSVCLRGKWDSVDKVDDFLFIQENKTKSQIDLLKLTRQLHYDLQSMLYIVALEQYKDHCFFNRSNKRWRGLPIAGVRYNVIRRSAHKSPESMVKKITEDRESGRIAEWFARLNITIVAKDIQNFCFECLDPILENLCDDYEWWTYCCKNNRSPYDQKDRGKLFKHHYPRHYRMPYFYNPIADGAEGDLDRYMNEGSLVGLSYTDNLFPELTDKE